MTVCPKCEGSGELRVPVTEHMGTVLYGTEQCDECGGSGYVNMTNEEWLCGLSTEEKARFLDRICYSAWGDRNSRFKDMADYTDWVEWLKEKHDGNMG